MNPIQITTMPSAGQVPFVTATERIIEAHGFARITEWEYECEKNGDVVCLRIWIGRKRGKKNMRILHLTEEDKQQVDSYLNAIRGTHAEQTA